VWTPAIASTVRLTRGGDMRVFYDVNDEMGRVEVLGCVNKADTPVWLTGHGVPE
jgi:hypothetical protein